MRWFAARPAARRMRNRGDGFSSPPAAAVPPGLGNRRLRRALDAGETRAAAQAGTRGAGGPLPHLARIQASFGRHDVSRLVAHADGSARAATHALEAHAFTIDKHVAFDGTPDLRTAAHEAAHAVQQAHGASLPGGVGAPGDRYERGADAVADRVARGQSSEHLLDGMVAEGRGPSAAAPVVQKKAWVWRSGKWEEIDPSERGQTPGPGDRGSGEGEVFDPDTKRWYRDVASYRQHTSRLTTPPFVTPELPDPLPIGVPPVTSSAADRLRGFVTGGVKTPDQLGSQATTSSDEKSRSNEISVNAFSPTGTQKEAARVAHYAVTHAANGTLPIVIEQKGDRPTVGNEALLQQRAFESALAVIRPDDLSSDQQGALRTALTMGSGGGEVSLTGGIAASSFVRVLVPISFFRHFSSEDIRRYKIQFVGRKRQSVAYNVGHQTTDVTIDVPDYESALAAIFRANPESIFLTHAIRLGPPRPITRDAPRLSSESEHKGEPVRESEHTPLLANDLTEEEDKGASSVGLDPFAASRRESPPPRRRDQSPPRLPIAQPRGMTHEETIQQSIHDIDRMLDHMLEIILPPGVDAAQSDRRALRLPYLGRDPLTGRARPITPNDYR